MDPPCTWHRILSLSRNFLFGPAKVSCQIQPLGAVEVYINFHLFVNFDFFVNFDSFANFDCFVNFQSLIYLIRFILFTGISVVQNPHVSLPGLIYNWFFVTFFLNVLTFMSSHNKKSWFQLMLLRGKINDSLNKVRLHKNCIFQSLKHVSKYSWLQNWPETII